MSDMEVLKEIPGYKAILKSVLKSQIQLLMEQLSEHAGEESIVLTASVSDGSLSHLGSSTAKGFFEGRDEIKSQFLGYCLKTYHKQLTKEAPKPYQRKQPSPRHSPTGQNKRYRPYPTSHSPSESFHSSGLSAVPDSYVNQSDSIVDTSTSAFCDTNSEPTVKMEFNESSSAAGNASSSFQFSHTQSSDSAKDTEDADADNVDKIQVKVEQCEDELEITDVELAAQAANDWGQGQPGFIQDRNSSFNTTADQSGYSVQDEGSVDKSEMLHQCECGRSFPRRDGLRQHIRAVHSSERNFSCFECEETPL